MTTTSTTTRRAGRTAELAPALGLARAEVILLRRNSAALFTALLMPLLLVGSFSLLPSSRSGAAPLLALTCQMVLLFVMYYTLVTAAVARREEHTLKRLYTSNARPTTVLVAMALPLVGLLVLQIGVGLAGVAVLRGLGHPPAPWLLVVAVLGGAAVWWVLALLSTLFTRSVEAAQLTTLPVLLLALVGSGSAVPLAVLPVVLQTLASLTPMYPVVDLVYLGFAGVAATGEPVSGSGFWLAVLRDVAVLAAWTVGGLAVLRRRFRWEPRR